MFTHKNRNNINKSNKALGAGKWVNKVTEQTKAKSKDGSKKRQAGGGFLLLLPLPSPPPLGATWLYPPHFGVRDMICDFFWEDGFGASWRILCGRSQEFTNLHHIIFKGLKDLNW